MLNLVIPLAFLLYLPVTTAILGFFAIFGYAALHFFTLYRSAWVVLTAVAVEMVLLVGMLWFLSAGFVWMVFYPAAARAESNASIEALAKVPERDRITQDMHDLMGHDLSVITLKAQLAERLVTKNPVRAVTEIRDIENSARMALARVRE